MAEEPFLSECHMPLDRGTILPFEQIASVGTNSRQQKQTFEFT